VQQDAVFVLLVPMLLLVHPRACLAPLVHFQQLQVNLLVPEPTRVVQARKRKPALQSEQVMVVQTVKLAHIRDHYLTLQVRVNRAA